VHVIFGLLALLAVFNARGPELVGAVASVALVAVIAYDVVALIARQPGDIFGVRWPGLVRPVAPSRSQADTGRCGTSLLNPLCVMPSAISADQSAMPAERLGDGGRAHMAACVETNASVCARSHELHD
jgi:hypothetical protein